MNPTLYTSPGPKSLGKVGVKFACVFPTDCSTVGTLSKLGPMLKICSAFKPAAGKIPESENRSLFPQARPRHSWRKLEFLLFFIWFGFSIFRPIMTSWPVTRPIRIVRMYVWWRQSWLAADWYKSSTECYWTVDLHNPYYTDSALHCTVGLQRGNTVLLGSKRTLNNLRGLNLVKLNLSFRFTL